MDRKFKDPFSLYETPAMYTVMLFNLSFWQSPAVGHGARFALWHHLFACVIMR